MRGGGGYGQSKKTSLRCPRFLWTGSERRILLSSLSNQRITTLRHWVSRFIQAIHLCFLNTELHLESGVACRPLYSPPQSSSCASRCDILHDAKAWACLLAAASKHFVSSSICCKFPSNISGRPPAFVAALTANGLNRLSHISPISGVEICRLLLFSCAFEDAAAR